MIGLINTKISNLGSVQRWLKALNLDFKLIEVAEDFVDNLPSDRLIQLIAQGRTYVELLKKLPNTSVLL